MDSQLQEDDPTEIGDYRLISRLGEGGFGVVYLAQTPGGEDVAIKVLRPELSNNPEVRERLRREAITAQTITSPRVARILGADIDADRPYLVMERVEGATLAEHVAQRGPLAGALLTGVATAIAEALDDIHRSGFLHRDLKPSNVMIGPDGIKILDFGIAAVIETADFTQTGAVLGSAVWMSPEQITGSRVGEWSDVFAMGLVLAFAALGRHPYGEGRPEALMYRIDTGEPDLSGLADPVSTLVRAMLRRDLSQRPTVGSIIDFLNGATSSLDAVTGSSAGVREQSPTPPDSTRVISTGTDTPVLPRKRRRVLVVAAGTLFVGGGVLASLWGAGLLPGRGQQAAPPTTPPLQVATTTVLEPEAAPTTTARTQIATTTNPPVPVYKLLEFDGYTVRWNPCQNPISIWLNNSDGSLSSNEMAALGGFLQKQALELFDITGHLILYRGLTEESTSATYKNGEKILIQVSSSDDGLLEPDKNFAFQSFVSWDRRQGSSAEIDSFQVHIDSNQIALLPGGGSSPELSQRSKRLLMNVLGRAFGLDDLESSDFRAFGVTSAVEMRRERMYWDGIFSSIQDVEWGPGDRLGMLLAQTGECF